MNYGRLKNHIARLKKLRDAYHDQLDAGALAELDDVLQQLTRLAKSGERDVPLDALGIRVLLIIDTVLRLVTNLTDLMR